MNRTDCEKEHLSTRMMGVIILLASLLLVMGGLVILPVVGFIFSAPLLILGMGMIFAPESKACRIIMGHTRSR